MHIILAHLCRVRTDSEYQRDYPSPIFVTALDRAIDAATTPGLCTTRVSDDSTTRYEKPVELAATKRQRNVILIMAMDGVGGRHMRLRDSVLPLSLGCAIGKIEKRTATRICKQPLISGRMWRSLFNSDVNFGSLSVSRTHEAAYWWRRDAAP